MRLTQFQTQFKKHLLERGAGNPVSQEYGSNLDVYGQGHRASLYRSLGHKYGVTALYVGQSAFSKISEKYIHDHPLKSPYLSQYGDGFHLYMACPVSQSLAKLEWIMHKALLEYKPEPSVRLEDIPLPDPLLFGETSFRLKKNVKFFKSSYNLKSIWSALKQKKTSLVLPQETYFLIGTEGQNSFFMDIKKEDYYALFDLRMGSMLLPDHQIHKYLHKFLEFLTKG